jgi:S1-C subfamily serine protease
MAPRGTGVARAHPLGDSCKVTVGEEVVAIRNPLGLDFSLSSGVVSATDRELQSSNGATISGGIQTADPYGVGSTISPY